MSSQPSSDLAAAMAARRPDANQDQLAQIRSRLRELRDKEAEQVGLQERLTALSVQINKMKTDELPTMFTAAGIRSLGVEAEGNMPAYDLEMRAYYKANISADWPPEKQDAAFEWLVQAGHQDMIKHTIVIEVGLRQKKLMDKVSKLLERLNGEDLVITVRRAVPWNTLTAFVREQIEKYKERPPLDLLGATVGQIVERKKAK